MRFFFLPRSTLLWTQHVQSSKEEIEENDILQD